MSKQYYVYILTNKHNTVLYVGVTSNLQNRISAHIQGTASKFAAKYQLTKLVYFELFEDVNDAIDREKRLKRWKRTWKNELIEASNPTWRELPAY